MGRLIQNSFALRMSPYFSCAAYNMRLFPLAPHLSGRPLLLTTPTNTMASIGPLAMNGKESLWPKLASCRCTANISTAPRAGFFHQGGLVPRSICPMRVFFGCGTIFCRSGEPPAYSRPCGALTLTESSKKAFRTAGIPGVAKYATHCYRSGAAVAILHPGDNHAGWWMEMRGL